MKSREADASRLLFIIPSLRSGGAERQLVELLRQLDPAHYEMTLVTLTDRAQAEPGLYGEVEAMRHVRIDELPRRGRFDVVGPLLQMVRIIRRRRIDLIHSFLNLGSTFGLVAARLSNVPIVASAIRDGADPNWVYKACRVAQAHCTDYLVSNSEAGFDQRFRHRRPNFRVIGNGIDIERFTKRPEIRAQIRAELGLSRFGHLVGMVATLSEFKNHEAFLDVAARILAERPDTGFVIVGDGPTRSTLEMLSRKLDVDKSVMFTGHRSDADSITGMLDVACLFTNHHVIEEGLPNVVMEAMASGVPVVATAGGGTPELISDGIEGFLIVNNDVAIASDRILRLLGDARLRHDMGQKGQQVIAERFSLKACVASYEALYASLLERR